MKEFWLGNCSWNGLEGLKVYNRDPRNIQPIIPFSEVIHVREVNESEVVIDRKLVASILGYLEKTNDLEDTNDEGHVIDSWKSKELRSLIDTLIRLEKSE